MAKKVFYITNLSKKEIIYLVSISFIVSGILSLIIYYFKKDIGAGIIVFLFEFICVYRVLEFIKGGRVIWARGFFYGEEILGKDAQNQVISYIIIAIICFVIFGYT